MNTKVELDWESYPEYRYGLHSNIPECCVKFFIERRSYANLAEYCDIMRGDGPWKNGNPNPNSLMIDCCYVLCNECYYAIKAGTKTYNTIHTCSNENEECRVAKICYEQLCKTCPIVKEY